MIYRLKTLLLLLLLPITACNIVSQTFSVKHSHAVEKELKEDVYKSLLSNNLNEYPVFRSLYGERISEISLNKELLQIKAIPVVDFSEDAINYKYGDNMTSYLVEAQPKVKSHKMARAGLVYYDKKLVGLTVQFNTVSKDSDDWHFGNDDVELIYTPKEYRNLKNSLQVDDQVVYCRFLSQFGIIRDGCLLIFDHQFKLDPIEDYIEQAYMKILRFQNTIKYFYEYGSEAYKKEKAAADRNYKKQVLSEAIFRRELLRNSIVIDDYYSSFRTYAYRSIDENIAEIQEGIKNEIERIDANMPASLLAQCQEEYIRFLRDSKTLETSSKQMQSQRESDFLKKMHIILGVRLFGRWKKEYFQQKKKWNNLNQAIAKIEEGKIFIQRLKKELGCEYMSNNEFIFHDNGISSREKIIKYYTDRPEIYEIPENNKVEASDDQ
ncbi:hypothetical protein K5X82_12825 [Halosquirtibacter xylanolyticus]|uniref:hypothetical protein n=1 Tax=Halosquirtibacter xylanolyticus TaxID=3374599 RepID=UPI003748F090|nr:hypothetical protein K5X82_12825 [Prolixibacteraceae bacterium]